MQFHISATVLLPWLVSFSLFGVPVSSNVFIISCIFLVVVFSVGMFSVNIWLLVVFEHTCAYARWAHMHRFLSGRLSVVT